MIFVMVTMAIPCMKRIAEVLNEKSTIVNPENPIYEVENGNISFENVSFKYSKNAEKNALNNINLNIKEILYQWFYKKMFYSLVLLKKI